MIGYLDPDIVNYTFGDFPSPQFRMEDNFIKEPIKQLPMARTLFNTFYLAVKQSKFNSLSARLTSKHPSLAPDERAIKIRVAIPESLFKTPQLEFDVVIPDKAVTPQVLSADVQDNIKSLIEQQTGFAITLNVIDKLDMDDEQS